MQQEKSDLEEQVFLNILIVNSFVFTIKISNQDKIKQSEKSDYVTAKPDKIPI
ncbi:hypothetical protein [Spiroplasma endosymbiont of Nebria brevicollis]|uniref:hypothetical protein n=1 Tax=Spiroplasma endosymbiont of Nebria brevicollis TaxID=3066284 RepID=UPI00313CD412